VDFIFIHGGVHDGWCWHLVREQLEQRGHRTWAPDLPCEDLELGSSAYADVVLAECNDAGRDAILVSHSQGGLTAPIVATRRPIAKMIFVAASIPEVGQTMNNQFDWLSAFAPRMQFVETDELGRMVFPEALARDCFYEDCSSDLADEAVRHLRPQGMVPFTEIAPFDEWPDVEVGFVHGWDDRSLLFSYSERVAKERFGLEVVGLPGGHSPFLARPLELTEVLLGMTID
jgi:pimeloyl-ACP methyl ester carboxylesterase